MTRILQSLPQAELPSGEKVASVNNEIPAEIPAPPVRLSAKEKKLWVHATTALLDYGLIHRTDAMLLAVICKTFIRWAEAEQQLSDFLKSNNGNLMVETPNGYAQPHQLYYLARSLKKELLQWLPEAALTIPSFAKAIQNRHVPVQGSLFDDPVEKHRKEKPVPMRAV